MHRSLQVLYFFVSAALLSWAACSNFASAQTLLEDDFDDNSAGWTFESLTGNAGVSTTSSIVDFGIDYSTFGIPEAPNSAAGDTATSGVRLRTNADGFPKDQAAIWIEDANFAGNYTVQVDMWLNWPPDPEALGTTIFGGVYVGDARNAGEIDTGSPIQRGAGYIANSDGDCGNCAHVLTKNLFELDTYSGQYSVRDFGFGNQPGYDESDANTDPTEGDLISLPALLPSFNIDDATGGVQMAGENENQKAGAVGFQWVTITAEVEPSAVGSGPNTSDLGTAKFSLTNSATGESIVIGTVDNSQPDILDDDMDGDMCDTSEGSEDICVNLNEPLLGDVPVDMEGRLSLVIIDFFSGAASDTNLSFALYDNLKIFATDDGLAGDFDGSGTVDIEDYTVWRDNLGAADELSLNGNGNGAGGVDEDDYLLWVSQFNQTAGSLDLAEGSTVAEPSALVLAAMALLLGSTRPVSGRS